MKKLLLLLLISFGLNACTEKKLSNYEHVIAESPNTLPADFTQEETIIPVSMFMCDGHAVAVQFTESYSEGIEIPVKVDLESDDPICISAKNHLFRSEGRLRHNDKTLPYESFVTQWWSGDNFDEFYKYDVGDDFR